MEKIQIEADETILIQVRKHWFILALEVLGVVIGAIVPLLFIGTFSALGASNALNVTLSMPGSLMTALSSAWILIMWMTLFNIWTNYYLDVWTVTNKRLIAIDQKGLFNRSISSFRLERLQDLNVEINGILGTLLNFGSLRAQTAGGDNQEFKATGLPDPRELKALILNASDAVLDGKAPAVNPKMEV